VQQFGGAGGDRLQDLVQRRAPGDGPLDRGELFEQLLLLPQ
jgi:hypothetical protein